MASETILVVDDSPDMLNSLEKYLGSLGYKVITALDGDTGLKLATMYEPDLILLDLNMPRMTGLDMLAALRKSVCDMPVILITVYGSERIAVKAFRMGVRDYLNKPFTVEEVKTAIDNALRERRLIRQQEQLKKKLLQAQAIQTAIVTLSHYLNNYLTALKGGLTLLSEASLHSSLDPEILNNLVYCRRSAASIQAVMEVLLNDSYSGITPYDNSISILDIEKSLEKRLSQMPEFRKSKE